MAGFAKLQRHSLCICVASHTQGFGHVQAQHGIRWTRITFGQAVNSPAGARIDQPIRPQQRRAFLRGGEGFGNIGAGAATFIEQSALPKGIKCRAVCGRAFRLPHNGFGPVEAQPCKIVVYLRLPRGARTRFVDVFYSKDKRAPRSLCHIGSQQSGIGMAQMQGPCRRWGKTCSKGQAISIT